MDRIAAFLSRPRIAPLVVLAVWTVGASAIAVDPAMVLLISAGGLLAWCGEGWYILATHPEPPIHPLGPRAFTIVLIVAIISTAALDWPLRLAFLLSRPALDAVADGARSGDTTADHQRVGLFVIDSVRPGEDVICLWTEIDGYSNTGLVRRHEGREHPDLHACSVIRLDDRWNAVFVTNCKD